LHGLQCATGDPLISAPVEADGVQVGHITAGVHSPYLQMGIGYALFDTASHQPGDTVMVGCRDGALHSATLVELPMYDALAEIPRGKKVDIPERP
jgi:aminomethyltransferase